MNKEWTLELTGSTTGVAIMNKLNSWIWGFYQWFLGTVLLALKACIQLGDMCFKLLTCFPNKHSFGQLMVIDGYCWMKFHVGEHVETLLANIHQFFSIVYTQKI